MKKPFHYFVASVTLSSCLMQSCASSVTLPTPSNQEESSVEVRSWNERVDGIVRKLDGYRRNSNSYETFLFFSDPHFFAAGGYEIDWNPIGASARLFSEYNDAVNADFLVCGGDLLNNSDTKSQAIHKLTEFSVSYRMWHPKSYFVIGNHDTNYQGDACMKNGDWRSCILSQETLNSIFYDDGESYYKFVTDNASHYCFDSGIDWLADQVSDYQWDELHWFAESLLTDAKKHKTVFIHIALMYDDVTLTAMMSAMGEIISAYNRKEALLFDGSIFDYQNCVGTIDFIQAGHAHKDIVGPKCGGVPIVVTTSFNPSSTCSDARFDVVFVDYSNSKAHFLRAGAGEDRHIDFSSSET